MRKKFNGKILFTVFMLCCFMATGLWAAKKVDIDATNANGYIEKLNQQAFESTPPASVFGLTGDETLDVLRSRTDFNRVTHYRYQQSYKGIPVWGVQTVISVGTSGKVVRLNGAVVQDIARDIGSVPGNSSLDPQGALRDMQEEHKRKDAAAKWIFDNEEYGTYIYLDKKGKARLVYVVSFFADNETGNPSRMVYFINVKNGKILHSYENLQTGDGTGPGGNLKVGYYYYGPGGDYPGFGVSVAGSTCTMDTTDVKSVNLNHGTSGSTAYSYTCYENLFKEINGAYSPINDAQYFGQVVYDMYQDWYGLPVLPFQLMMRVHYSTNYENAFWNGSSMTFGDGYTTFYPLVSLDVSAHEVAHGFTDNHSDLIYSGQSGGINEAYSDMAGESSEYYMRGSTDYMCGYDIFKAADQALRYLYDPPLDGISIDHVNDYYDGMNVHYSSGIFNKVYYLVATTNGWTPRMAFDIFTKANTDYWTPSTTFQQGAEGAMNAAVDYGYPCQDVVNAFAQVGIVMVCPGPPVADFSAFPTVGGVPLTTTFTDASQAASSWLWDFGDGNTSTAQNPTHTYTVIGNYTVTLTATNQFGSDVETKVDYITVTAPQPPIADFTADNTDINLGNSVQFTDTSMENPTSWQWTFEGGTPAVSTEQNPVVTYNTVGTFDVTLVATNAQGSDTMTKVDYITVSVKPYCTSSGGSQSYEYIAGVQVADLNNPSGATPYSDFTGLVTHLTQGGTVSVALTPGFPGSSYTEYWKIWIDYNDDHDFEDAGEEVFSGSGSSVVTGSFTVPINTITGDTRMRVSMSYSTSPPICGTFTYGEVEDYTANIVYGGNLPPVADFTFTTTDLTAYFTDTSSDPDGVVVSWLWDFGDGNTSTAQNPTHTYASAGTYSVSLTVTDDDGATDTVSKDVTVTGPNVPPTAGFTYTVTCLTVEFTDTSTDPDGTIDTWLWDFGDGNTSTLQNPTHTYAVDGTYTVSLTVTDNDGASDTATQAVSVADCVDEMYVYDITQTINVKGKNRESVAVVTIWDTTNAPVANATVTITWSGSVNGSATGVTLADGTVTFKSSKTKDASGSFTITVDNVTHASLPYNPALNNETSDTVTF